MIYTMPKHRTKRHIWTDAELAIVRARYPHEDTKELAAELGVADWQLQHCANRHGIHKTPEALSAAYHRYAIKNGIATRFHPGLVPHNKGKKLPDHVREKSAHTWFRDGHMPSTRVPIGTVRWRKGQWYQKVKEDRAPARKDWRPVAHIVYERDIGPIPDGHVVAFRNRNPNDIRAENLEAITRVKLMQRNTWHRYPAEVKAAISAKRQLTRAIKAQEKANEKQTARPARSSVRDHRGATR